MEQRSSEWYDMRLGRFTASKISLILGKLTTEKGKTSLENLAIKKAGEMYFGQIENDFVSFDMQRGIDNEPMAFAKFSELMSLEFLQVEQCGFIPFGLHGGASPDGKVSNGCNLEIKNPTIETFNKLVCTNEIKDEYNDQMQKQMLCLDTDLSYFFNYVIYCGKEYCHTIEVPRNEQRISLIKERIEIATEIKLKHYETLCSRFGGKGFISFFDTDVNTIINEPIKL